MMKKSEPISGNHLLKRVCYRLFLLGLVALAILISPYVWILLGGFIVPWTLLPPSYPNARMMTMVDVPYDMDSVTQPIKLMYCTNATVDDLEEFFAPIVGEFRVYGQSVIFNRYAFENVENVMANALVLSAYIHVEITGNHPDCSTGSAYQISIRFS
jgi:hypothetical protein